MVINFSVDTDFDDGSSDQLLIIILSCMASAVALAVLFCGLYVLYNSIRKDRKVKKQENPPKRDIIETMKDLR